MTTNLRLPTAIAVLLLLALGACGGSSSTTDAKSTPTSADKPADSTGAPAASASAVQIKGFAFAPATFSVKSGGEVTVTNADAAAHTFTADDKSFDSKEIAEGKSATVRISGHGAVAFHCEIHDYMKGTVTIT